MTNSSVLGVVGIFGLLALMALGTPVGIALLTVGIVGNIVILGLPGTLGIAQTLPYHTVASWALFVLPMFFLLGSFASLADLGDDLFKAAYLWVGRLPGGLAVTCIAGSTALAFVSGSSTATSALFAGIAFPEMKKYNYDKRMAAGCIASSGTLAALIPPSGLMVVYCSFANISLGSLMIAGILPGFLVAILLGALVIVWAKFLLPGTSFRAEIPPIKQRLASLKHLIWVAVIAATIVGGIYFGIFTPTEAGAVSATLSLIMLFSRKGFHLKHINQAVTDTLATTSMIFLIILGALMFARFIATSGLVKLFSVSLLSLSQSPHVAVLIMLFTFLVLGTFLDAIGCLALTMPLFFPVTVQMGIDQVWFAVLVIMMVEVGLLTPPVALQAFVVAGALKNDVTLEDVFKGITPFFVTYLLAVAIVFVFPPIATWLPSGISK